MNLKHYLKSYLLFLVGLFVASMGVDFSTKAGLGTSPVASVPYSISLLSGALTFGGGLICGAFYGFWCRCFCWVKRVTCRRIYRGRKSQMKRARIKRTMTLVLVCIMSLGISGCGNTNRELSCTLNVVATYS